MLNTVLLVLGVFIAGMLSSMIGYALGSHYLQLREQLRQLSDKVNAAEEEDEVPAVIETTPNLIRKKERSGQLNDEGSAVVTVKNARQIRADKQRKEAEDMQRYS